MTEEKYSSPPGFVPPCVLAGADTDTPVLVAFSGGADSSTLLSMTVKYARAHGGRVFAAHVNHMIRGVEADRDEEFCRKAAASLGVEIFVHRFDVPRYAAEQGLSIETAARLVRYDFFDKVMSENDIPLLATAHNANDNLETQLFNLARGCGLDGICGIPETRKCKHGTVVRPLLRMSRERILGYCQENSISYVTDSTNTDTDYTRNMIRAEIIPSLRRINAGAVENASRLAVSLHEDALCLDSMADWFLEELNDDASMELEKLLGSPPAIASRAIRSLYSHVSDGGRLEQVHMGAIRSLCESGVPHSSLNLPHGVQAKIEQGRLYLEKSSATTVGCEEYFSELKEGVNTLSAVHAQIIIGNSQKTLNIYKKSIRMYFDFATINGALTVRSRKAGDKIRLNGVNRSVKKLLCDMKIPLEIRYRLPMICDSDGIVAIPFAAIRDGAKYKGADADSNALGLVFGLL